MNKIEFEIVTLIWQKTEFRDFGLCWRPLILITNTCKTEARAVVGVLATN